MSKFVVMSESESNSVYPKFPESQSVAVATLQMSGVGLGVRVGESVGSPG